MSNFVYLVLMVIISRKIITAMLHVLTNIMAKQKQRHVKNVLEDAFNA